MPKASLYNYPAMSLQGGPTVKAKSPRSQRAASIQLPFKLAHYKWIYLNSLNQMARFCCVLLYLMILLLWERYASGMI